MNELTPVWARREWIGDPAIEARLRAQIDAGALSHGWLITGPNGVGKATLAYRIARAVLAPDGLAGADGLAVDPGHKNAHLVETRAHPDLYIAERRWDDKKGRLETEISVETIRALTGFLARTASFGGWRVAIIDAADDLNRNAANALLKVLEEPPKNALLMLVCSAPGRLIATIRSRCRRIELRPVAEREVANFLHREGYGDDADAVAGAAGGRPGYGLQLAAGEGGEAIAALEDFFKACRGGDFNTVAQSLTGKAGDARWVYFKPLLLDRVSLAARKAALGAPDDYVLSKIDAPHLADLWAELSAFLDRADGLHLDRAQIIHGAGRKIKTALRQAAA